MLRLRQPDHRDKRPTITIGCCQSQTDREEKKHKFVCTMLLLVEQTTPRVWEPGTPGSRTAETAEREREEGGVQLLTFYGKPKILSGCN